MSICSCKTVLVFFYCKIIWLILKGDFMCIGALSLSAQIKSCWVLLAGKHVPHVCTMLDARDADSEGLVPLPTYNIFSQIQVKCDHKLTVQFVKMIALAGSVFESWLVSCKLILPHWFWRKTHFGTVKSSSFNKTILCITTLASDLPPIKYHSKPFFKVGKHVYMAL